MFVNNPSIGRRRKLELEFQCDVDDENNGESTSGGEMTEVLRFTTTSAEKIRIYRLIYFYY